MYEQWLIDVASPSTFSGTIASSTTTAGVLTLTTNAVGPMWEGEVLGCNPFSLNNCAIPRGTYISNLASGAWGASGSTYNLISVGNTSGAAFPVSSAIAMENAVQYQGAGPVIYAGTLNDVAVQQLAQIPGQNANAQSYHGSNGFAGAGVVPAGERLRKSGVASPIRQTPSIHQTPALLRSIG